MTKALLAKRARLVRMSLVSEVPSPCMSVCRMDAVTGWCEGCRRTLEEVADWGRMDDGGKRVIWALIEQRLALEAAMVVENPRPA